ncbi:MAG: D-alanine--D-alanine ligase, partial [Myxococcales bacterium]
PVTLDPGSFASEFVKSRPDAVFNLCESLGGDSRGEIIVPALLELLGLPYTGSGPLALGLALHKVKAKQLLRSMDVPTPAFAVVTNRAEAAALELPFPLMVKPAHEDASIGIDRNSVVHDRSALLAACSRILDGLHQPALVEQYVEGREIYCAILGREPLPLTEIDFSGLDASHPRILTYAAKWDEASHEFQATPSVPCALSAELQARVVDTARRAFDALECRDYARVDLRLSNDGVPYVIEVNPNCDLSPSAGFARAARAAGIDYETLVWRLVEAARGRHAHPSAFSKRSSTAQGAARKDRRVHAGRGGVRRRADRPGSREA